MSTPSIKALIPFATFLTLFIGVGSYLTLQGVEFAFYQLPAPIAALPAVIIAILMSKESINKAIEQFIRGVGHSDIIAMCMIYLLAGAFASVAKATGGVDATVNLGLSLLPPSLILPGMFVIAAFIATAMGTSMGTIAALAPVALGIADAAGIDHAIAAGAVLGGAMFGDNLSIISDTTIAATRSQGCEMKDKFKENISIALPAAVVSLILFGVLGTPSTAPIVSDFNWINVLPYISILILAVSGINVFAVLTIGTLMAGVIGLSTTVDYSLTQYGQDIYTGFGNMQEIFLLSMLIGGLSELMKQQGGLNYITEKLSNALRNSSQKSGEFGIALLVSLVNCCTANNTVSILVSGSIAKDLAKKHGISAKRSASLLDIFSCIMQGILPYGAQVLLIGSILQLSPLEVTTHSYYCYALAISAIATVLLKKTKQPRH
ncbi:Na+/H+ antiporter NhaC family protein [Vibrio tapetis subsp. quintayensis]|uniref:Na+/H+ antiporter NhaC family protein n=1 Tax=Vibrio tapetis TaxID=52443 RepID=UPI0025B40C8A|nr:Na+/H+ antiporter NhaC family protein [Vibrio tapetis]MDN3680596.1 Na+/H+ antiporter NhaC family protein [Vibrio tapetis subsp. quintayensis]